MKILVTGGLGFIGLNFIDYWLRKYNDEIINIDKATYAANSPDKVSVPPGKKYRLVKGDISSELIVSELVRESDCIVNFAAETHVDNSIENSTEFIRTNVMGTQVLLEQARRYDKRFHHISTDEVFGSLPLGSNERFTADTCYKPRNPYSASKAAADHLVNAYFNTYGVPVTISNCSNNFGPHQNTEKLIPKTVAMVSGGKKVPIYGEGNQIRDWTYVEDHCEAIDVILKKGRLGENYLVGANNERSNLDVVSTIIRFMEKSPEDYIEHVADRPGHDERYAIDASKLIRELGWCPRHDFESALRNTIEHYVRQGISST